MPYRSSEPKKDSFPPIPVTFLYHGDTDKAKKLVGFGRKRLAELNGALSFQRIYCGKNHYIDEQGFEIHCSVVYGVSTVDIFVPTAADEGLEQASECFCGCGVTAGTIVCGDADSSPDPDLWVPQPDSKYKCKLCADTRFSFFGEDQKVPAADFFQHRGPENDSNGAPTRTADIMYGIIREKDIDGVHVDLMEVFPCSWKFFRLISLEVQVKHHPKLSEKV